MSNIIKAREYRFTLFAGLNASPITLFNIIQKECVQLGLLLGCR